MLIETYLALVLFILLLTVALAMHANRSYQAQRRRQRIDQLVPYWRELQACEHAAKTRALMRLYS